MDKNELQTQIILESRAIFNLELQKKIVSNLLSENHIRLKFFRLINKEIKEKVEALEEKIKLLEG